MKNIKTIVFFSILIGIVALALNVAFGNETILFLQKIRYPHIDAYYYKFDFARYFQNIEMSITDTSKLALSMPTRTWQQMTASNFGEALSNNMALLLDYVIFIINILIYPMRIGSYIVKNLLTLIGINSQQSDYNGLYWLMELLNWLIERVEIPYV